MDQKTENKTAIITGASAGLGKEFARQIARAGSHRVVLVARRRERLEELQRELIAAGASAGVEIITADLSQHKSRLELISSIEERGLSVDLLVNNAGFGSVGALADSDLDWERAMVEVNCLAPLHLTRHFLPQMIQRRSGKVINVCSTAAFQPMAFMATYGATKAFLLSFSMALAAENAVNRVFFLADCPGPTDTEFHLVAGLPDKMSFLPAMSAEQVVREALNAVSTGSGTFVHGWLNWLLSLVGKVMPPLPAAKVVARILRRHR